MKRIPFVLMIFFGYSISQISYNQEFQVNTYTISGQSRPAISNLKDGGFVICWQSYGQDGSSLGIFGQIFNNDGSKRGDEIHINTHTDGPQRNPDIYGKSDGGFVVIWESEGSNQWDDIYAQLFDNAGRKQGTEIKVNLQTHTTQALSKICNYSDLGFLIAWEIQNQELDRYEFYGQFFKMMVPEWEQNSS